MEMVKNKTKNWRLRIIPQGFDKENKQQEWSEYLFSREFEDKRGAVNSGVGCHTHTVNIIVESYFF